MHHSAQPEKPGFTIALSVALLIGYIYGMVAYFCHEIAR